MEIQENFSQIIAKYFIKRGSSVAYCKQFYPNENYINKARVLNRYISGDIVPSFEIANELLTNLNEHYSKDELLEILDRSKKLKEENKSDNSFCSKLKIRYTEIDRQLSISISSEDALTNRLRVLGLQNSKEYILKLIVKDIEETIL